MSDPTAETKTADVLQMIDAAMDEVIRVCSIDQRPRMSIPANPKRDTDLILMDALHAAKAAILVAGLVVVTPEATAASELEELRTLFNAARGNWYLGSCRADLDAAMRRLSDDKGQFAGPPRVTGTGKENN